jgi:ribonuclease HII
MALDIINKKNIAIKIKNQGHQKIKLKMFPNFNIEKQYQGKTIIGIDEVGRGPLAGPMVVSAIYIPQENIPIGINDSKLLSAKKREALFQQLTLVSKYGIGFVSVEEIDELKLTKATELAIIRALSDLDLNADIALIDGNIKYSLPIKSISVIAGDKKSLTIAAASIMAKVTRDKYMLELSSKYPVYGWHKNFGYGTKEHLDSITTHGISEHHRKSFSPIKNFS